eukprot:3481010-Rhodomonas_salina.2
MSTANGAHAATRQERLRSGLCVIQVLSHVSFGAPFSTVSTDKRAGTRESRSRCDPRGHDR